MIDALVLSVKPSNIMNEECKCLRIFEFLNSSISLENMYYGKILSHINEDFLRSFIATLK